MSETKTSKTWAGTRVTDKRQHTRGSAGSVQRAYHYDKEWVGYSLTRGRTGWIIESWSRITGSITGRRVIVPYSKVIQGIDPDAAYSACETWADMILDYSHDEDCRVLRRGTVVR